MDKGSGIFVNDGSFMERFKQMQQEKQMKESAKEAKASNSVTPVALPKPGIVLNKRPAAVAKPNAASASGGKLAFSLKQKSKIVAAPVVLGADDEDGGDAETSTGDERVKRQKLGRMDTAQSARQQGDVAPSPPSDAAVRIVADKLASFVSKNGRTFEQVTRQRNPGDTPFKFLYDTSCSDYKYYEYRLLEEEKALAQSNDPQALKTAIPSAAAPRSASSSQNSTLQDGNYQTPASALYWADEGNALSGRTSGQVRRMGATPIMELMIASGKAVAQLQRDHGLAVDRVYTGSFMTSLDMAGFSISIMEVDQAILQRLDAPTKASYWPVGAEGDRPPAKTPVPVPPSRSTGNEQLSRPVELNEQGRILEAAIEAAANEIVNFRDQLNGWDAKVGDGDCGSTMHRGATAILEDLGKCYPLNDAAETVNAIGASIRRVMGGTSGILYDIFCKAAYTKLKETPVITSKQWADALHASIAAVSKYGGAVAGYRTMLDALIPAATVLKERLDAGADPLDAFLQSSEASISGAEMTKQMQAQAGRSSYVSADIIASVPDPGAMAASAWYRAAALAVKNMQQP